MEPTINSDLKGKIFYYNKYGKSNYECTVYSCFIIWEINETLQIPKIKVISTKGIIYNLNEIVFKR